MKNQIWGGNEKMFRIEARKSVKNKAYVPCTGTKCAAPRVEYYTSKEPEQFI